MSADSAERCDGPSALQDWVTDDLVILDGGFATHLEDALHQDISSSLWSASLLKNEDGQRAIRQTHLDFLKAGARVVSTSTYQASPLSLRLAGIDDATARALIVRSVQLAQEAREEFVKTSEGRRPLLSLSLGPYGAALANGSEYTGVYFVPDDEQRRPTTSDDMSKFHFDRLQVVADSEAWQHVDLLAFETIPRLDEALAIREALDRLYSQTGCQRKPAYISFVFPNGEHLPFVPHGESATTTEQLIESTVGHFDGIGINCTKPGLLLHLVQKLSAGLRAINATKDLKKPYLFLYPDGGLVWNGQSRQWEGQAELTTRHWSSVVLEAAEDALQSAQWAGCFVGGCCKATVKDINDLKSSIEERKRV